MRPPSHEESAVLVHVVPRNLRWEVEVDGLRLHMIDRIATKERAISHAVEHARALVAGGQRDHAVVVVERSDHEEEARIVVA